jgi:hypothetical protein
MRNWVENTKFSGKKTDSNPEMKLKERSKIFKKKNDYLTLNHQSYDISETIMKKLFIKNAAIVLYLRI